MPNTRPEAHDILLIPPLQTREAAVVAKNPDKNGPTGMLKMSIREDGQYTSSKLLDANDEGSRKVYGIARPHANYGPGFAILPIRPDPGSQSDTCFLINTENLLLPNPWTAADWDVFDVVGAGDPVPTESDDTPVNEDWRALEQDLRVLIAGPKGNVYLVELAKGTATPITDLKTQVAIWTQLREGLIVGSVLYNGRVLPLVNVTSINVTRGGAK